MKLLTWFKKQFTCPECGSWDMTMSGRCRDCMLKPLQESAPPKNESARLRLPDRRPALRHRMKWADSRGDEHVADVSFGFDRAGAIREVFCLAKKDGTDMQGLVHDACIALSLALQYGARIADLARSFGELREESQATGRPASVIGAVARLGASVEAEMVEGAGA